MKLNKKKVFEICNTILSSADLDTITEKKVRRQVEEELGLEDKILDGDPYKSIVKEFVNKIINDLQQKSDSSCSPPPQVIQPKKTDSRSKTTIKSRKNEIKSKDSSKVLKDDDDLPNSKPLNNKARSKVSKQESSSTSKTQADKVQNKISKTYGESGMVSSSSKPTNREEKSKATVDISKKNNNKSSSSSRPTESNVTSKTTELDKEIPSEKESETALSIKRTSKSAEANNKEKQKPNVTRSRVKRKVNASSDDDDNKSNVLTTKGNDLEESVLPPPKRSKQIKINTTSDTDEEPNNKIRVIGKVNEVGQSRRKIEPVEDGGVVMALENKLLAQDSDIIESKSGDDVESDNTIKEDDDREVLKRTSESRGDGHIFQSVDEAKQELNGLKVESKSQKRTLDFKDEDEDDDLSSLEDIDDKPRNKKHKTEKIQTKSVNNKTLTKPVNNNSDKPVNNKSVDTVEKNEKKIKAFKSFINKCGVRKNWSKELADCGTDASKIRKLKKILEDLGVEGRPTLEKCKKVKKNLELEAELKAMDVDNIISDDIKETRKARASRGIFNPVRRKVSRVTQSSPEYDDSSSKDIQSDSE